MSIVSLRRAENGLLPKSQERVWRASLLLG